MSGFLGIGKMAVTPVVAPVFLLARLVMLIFVFIKVIFTHYESTTAGAEFLILPCHFTREDCAAPLAIPDGEAKPLPEAAFCLKTIAHQAENRHKIGFENANGCRAAS